MAATWAWTDATRRHTLWSSFPEVAASPGWAYRTASSVRLAQKPPAWQEHPYRRCLSPRGPGRSAYKRSLEINVSPVSPTCRGLTSEEAEGGRPGSAPVYPFDRARSLPALLAAKRRGRVWEPSQGSHLDQRGGLALRTKSMKYDSNHWPAWGAPVAASGPPHILSKRGACGSETPSDSPGGLTQK